MTMYRKSRKVVLVLLAIILLVQIIPLSARAAKTTEIQPFTDIKGHWAAATINKWQYYDIITGAGNNKFNPNGTILRRDFAVILDRLFKFSDTAINVFNDLQMGQYYTDPILRLTAAGILDNNTKYVRPNVNITREEATVMICKAFKIDPSKDEVRFTDAASISKEAYPYVAAMQSLQYIKGSGGKFDPKGTLTRAQAITIIDNIISAMYTKSGTYKNDYAGNGFINTKNVKIQNSTINGGLFIALGESGKATFDGVNIKKAVVVTSNYADIQIQGDTTIGELHIRADGVKVKNAHLIKKLVIGPESKTSEVSGMPESMLVKVGGKATVEGVVFANNTANDSIYIQESLSNAIAQQTGAVQGGPVISIKEVIQDMDNNISVEGISIKSSGDSEIKETGIVYYDSEDAPNISKYTKKIKYTGSEGNYKSFTINVGKQGKDEVWTYRAYAINKNGKIGYSNPIAVRGYSYEISTYMVDTVYTYNTNGNVSAVEKHFQIFIQGDNIPEISSVSALSGTTTGDKTNYKETKASLESSSEVTGYTKMYYTAKIKFNASKDGGVSQDTHYGYKIQFKGKVGTKELYPTFVLGSTSAAEVRSIVTGSASIDSSNRLIIVANDAAEGTLPILENGVVLLETSIGSQAPTSVNMAHGWVEYSNYTGIGSLTRNYTVAIELGNTVNKKYYYAAYAKTANQTVYGAIKSIEGTKE